MKKILLTRVACSFRIISYLAGSDNMCNELDKHWRDECGVFGIYLQDSSAP